MWFWVMVALGAEPAAQEPSSTPVEAGASEGGAVGALAVPASEDWAKAWVDTLVPLPAAERSARITAEIGARASDPAEAARLGQALAVSSHLERTERADPTVVRLFLKAALATEPAVRQQAVVAAEKGGDPPDLSAPAARDAVGIGRLAEPTGGLGARVTPSASGASESRYDLIRAYDQRHLYRDSLQFTNTTFVTGQYGGYATSQHVATWAVYDGGGRVVPPLEFADRVGDTERGAALDQTIRKRKSRGTALLVTGAGLGLASFGFIGSENVEARLAGWGLTLTGGTILACLGVIDVVRTQQLRSHVPRTWTPDEADHWITRHNDALRDELGLTPEEAREVESSD